MGKIIAVANQKGGVGKTTTAINLSACTAESGKETLLIDVDPQGNSTSGTSGIREGEFTKSSYDLIVGDIDYKDAVCRTKMENLDVIPATIDLVGAEVELVPMIAREMRLKNALKKAKQYYDYIFLDCPPSLGLITLNALCASDSVLVPIQCEFYALEGLSQLMNTVLTIRQSLNPKLGIEGVVMTMYDSRTKLSLQVVDEVRSCFKKKVYNTVIPRNVRLGEAPSFGMPIILYDSRCLGSEAYRNLAKELISA